MNSLSSNLDSKILQLQTNFFYFENQERITKGSETEETHICTDTCTVNKKKEIISAKFEEISQQIAQQKHTNRSLELTRLDLEDIFNKLSKKWSDFSKTITKLSIREAQSQFCPTVRDISDLILEIRRKNAAFTSEIRNQQTTQKTNADTFPEILKDEKIIDLLKGSLSYETKTAQKKFYTTFLYAEKLVQKILNGEYGDTIKEFLVTGDNSLVSPAGFLRLLIIDMCRNNDNLFDLETIRDIVENREKYCQTIAALENLMNEQEVEDLATSLAKTSNKTIESVYSDISESSTLPAQQLLNKVLGQLVQELVTDTDRKEKTVPYACISRNTFSCILEYITIYFRPQSSVLMQAIVGGLVQKTDNSHQLVELITDKQDKEDLKLLLILYDDIKEKNDQSFDFYNEIKTFDDLERIQKFIMFIVNANLIDDVLEFIYKLPKIILTLPDEQRLCKVDLQESLIQFAITTLTHNDLDKAISYALKLEDRHSNLGLTVVATTIQLENPEKAIEISQKITIYLMRYSLEHEIIEGFLDVNFEDQEHVNKNFNRAMNLFAQVSSENRDSCLQLICAELLAVRDFERLITVSELFSDKQFCKDVYEAMIVRLFKENPERVIALVKTTTAMWPFQEILYAKIFSIAGILGHAQWKDLLSQIPVAYEQASFLSFVTSMATSNKVARAIELVQQNPSYIEEKEIQKFVGHVFSALFSKGMIIQAFFFYETITPQGLFQGLDFDLITAKIPAFISKVSLDDIIETTKRLPEIGKLLCNAMTPLIILRSMPEQLSDSNVLHLARYFNDPVTFFNVVFSTYIHETPVDEILSCILSVQPEDLRFTCIKSFYAITKWHKKDDFFTKVAEILNSSGIDMTEILEYSENDKIKWDALTHQALVTFEITKTKSGMVQKILDAIEDPDQKSQAQSKLEKLENLLKEIRKVEVVTPRESMPEVDHVINDVSSEEEDLGSETGE